MTAVEQRTSRGRSAVVAALSVALLLAGLLLTAAASPPAVTPGAATPGLVAALLLAYVLGNRYPLDFEFRRESNAITLVQLPLALGIQVIAPMTHLLARLAAVLVGAVVERQASQKALYNAAAAAFEVGAAAFAVGLLAPGETGPLMWAALYGGLLVGDVVCTLVLHLIWRTLGLPVSVGRAFRTLALTGPVSLLFTALAIVTITAARVEPLTVVIMLLIAVWLGLAYRAHRRVLAQESTTEQLYAFVKDLGPLDLDSPETATTLEQVRVLLHAEQLDLAVPDGERWCHLEVAEGSPARRREATMAPSAAQERASTLRGRRRSGADSDSMVTSLMSASGLLGILTATHRLGNVRGFEMSDLRLLETIGTELSTALERGRLYQQLERAATRDPLTGLRNLAEVTRRLDELLTAAPGERVVLAAVAVDSFREVNDTLGHQVGDELLLEVARRLTSATAGALVGRIGGGRFAVAIPADDAGGDAEMFGLGLRSQVEGTAQIGPVGTHVRLSVGVVTTPEHGTDAATLVRRAETAMYSARDTHGGGPVLWEPAYEVQGQRRLAVVTALREALTTGAIGLAFQPKLEAASGRVTGVEALARWTHPALGRVGPDEFIPLAEASGLMGPLTTTVLQQSLAACASWQRPSTPIGVAVNVSADTVLDPAFVTEVAEALTAVGLPAELLTLELTEGVVVSDPVLAAARMEELRGLGVKLSIDDFGTGYSSLTYLKGLPIDEVKIDKGFVDGLTADPADRAVVRAVVDIAHTLGMRVVAEGVEQAEQEQILQALGVDEIQGYLHARPMPGAELTDWLRSQRTRARA